MFKVDFNPSAHGTSGPLQRTLPKWISDIVEPYTKGMSSLGVPRNPDSVRALHTLYAIGSETSPVLW